MSSSSPSLSPSFESLESHESQARPAGSNHAILPYARSQGTIHTTHHNQHANNQRSREQLSKPSLYETASPTSSMLLSTSSNSRLDSPKRGWNASLSSPKQQGSMAMVPKQGGKSPSAAVVRNGSLSSYAMIPPMSLESDDIRVRGSAAGTHFQQFPATVPGDGIRVHSQHPASSSNTHGTQDGIRVYSHVASPPPCMVDNDGIRVRGSEEHTSIVPRRPPPPPPPPLPIDPLTGLQHGHPAMQPLQAPPLRRKKVAPKNKLETKLDTTPKASSKDKNTAAHSSPTPTDTSKPKKGLFRKLAGLVRSKSRDSKPTPPLSATVLETKAPNEISANVDSMLAVENKATVTVDARHQTALDDAKTSPEKDTSDPTTENASATSTSTADQPPSNTIESTTKDTSDLTVQNTAVAASPTVQATIQSSADQTPAAAVVTVKLVARPLVPRRPSSRSFVTQTSHRSAASQESLASSSPPTQPDETMVSGGIPTSVTVERPVQHGPVSEQRMIGMNQINHSASRAGHLHPTLPTRPLIPMGSPGMPMRHSIHAVPPVAPHPMQRAAVGQMRHSFHSGLGNNSQGRVPMSRSFNGAHHGQQPVQSQQNFVWSQPRIAPQAGPCSACTCCMHQQMNHVNGGHSMGARAPHTRVLAPFHGIRSAPIVQQPQQPLITAGLPTRPHVMPYSGLTSQQPVQGSSHNMNHSVSPMHYPQPVRMIAKGAPRQFHHFDTDGQSVTSHRTMHALVPARSNSGGMLTYPNQHCHPAADFHSMHSLAPPRAMSGGFGQPNAGPHGSAIRSNTGGAGNKNQMAYHENASRAPNHQMTTHPNQMGHPSSGGMRASMQTGPDPRMMARATPHAMTMPRRHSMSSRSMPAGAQVPNGAILPIPVVHTQAAEAIVPSRPRALRSKSTRI
jgi:hypothetical protein